MTIPDLRNKFLRGTKEGDDVGSEYASQPHSHDVVLPKHTHEVGGGVSTHEVGGGVLKFNPKPDFNVSWGGGLINSNEK